MRAYVEVRGSASVITGAGSGIGRACALELASRGSSILVSDVDSGRAEAVAGEVVSAGGRAVALGCDVAKDDDVERLRDVCLEEFGRVDIVMNNVGVIPMGPPESLPLEVWQRAIDLNLLGMVRSNLVFLPLLIEQGRGHVVNTSSLSGLLPQGFNRLPYVATKHAVFGMSKALALYLAPKGIGVTCLCPAYVRTRIAEQITQFGEPEKNLVQRTDLHAAEPEEVGVLVADAVETGRFLVLTSPEVQDELVAQATDLDGYLAGLVAARRTQEP